MDKLNLPYSTHGFALLSSILPICTSLTPSLKLLIIPLLLGEEGEQWKAFFVGGDSEKGRYLLFRSLHGKTTNVPSCSHNETLRPRP